MMKPTLSRADEVFQPGVAEAYRRESDARRREREQLFKTITQKLLKNGDFQQWVNAIAIKLGYWRVPRHELTAYEQGRRAAIHEIVELILANGADEAEKWYAAASSEYTRWLQKTRNENA